MFIAGSRPKHGLSASVTFLGSALCAILFVIGVCVLLFHRLDQLVTQWAAGQESAFWFPAARWVTEIGRFDVLFAGIILVYSARAWVSKEPQVLQRASVAVLAMAFAGLSAAILKWAIARPRPVIWLATGQYKPAWFDMAPHLDSLPSGHATAIGAALVIVCIERRRLWPILVMLATFLAMTRILVHDHFPSDVVGGLSLGSLIAALVYQWRGRIEGSRPVAVVSRFLGKVMSRRT